MCVFVYKQSIKVSGLCKIPYLPIIITSIIVGVILFLAMRVSNQSEENQDSYDKLDKVKTDGGQRIVEFDGYLRMKGV